MESNHIIFWSGSHPENKIGIYILGGCDLPSVFSCVPLIKPILKGTCCILKEGQIEKSRSDILLQNLKDRPQDLLAPVLEKFYLPGNFFDNQLFSPSFGVSNGSNFEEFPKQVVILSIAPDVARVVYQHREHGFLIDPSGWWNNQRMDLMLRDLSSANWFRKHFVSLGRMTLETFIENFTQLINQIKQARNVHILVFNTLTIEPGNITHNYQFVKRPESLRRREFNIALVELSRKLNFWIVDIDKILKQTRTKNMVDFAHFPVELYQPIGQEVFRILEELEIFQVPSQSSKDSSRQWILGMTSWEEQVFLEDYTKNEYSGRGEIVELGCWLGSSTISLARGLEANSQVVVKNQRIHAYDIFTWVPAMEQIAKGTDVTGKFQDGDSFLDEYLKRINPWSHLIQVHPGNLTEIGWEGRAIEFLFIDAMKSWELTNSIIKNFFPSLIPGFSSIVHQDFAHYYETWIHLIMYRWREYFIPVDLPEVDPSKVFRYIKQIPNEVWHYSYSFDDFSRDEVEAAFDYSLSIVPPQVQRNVIAAKVMYFIQVGKWERAKLEFERATANIEREQWQELANVEAHLSPEKHDRILKSWGVGSSQIALNSDSFWEHKYLGDIAAKQSQLDEATLYSLLRDRASRNPDQTAYTLLEDGENEIAGLTYRQLDEKARAIAAYLQSQLSVGERVLLVYPQGLESIVAFFGCLYAGAVAIPAPAPEAARLKRILPRLEAIASDAKASLILTTASLLSHRETARETSKLVALPWTATEKIPSQLAAQWQQPEINGDTLAYLQYTSGSTSTPKGVMLDHNNLMCHLAELQQACGYDSNSITVTWMPYFHDYGLVEGILAPLYNGTPCYLMSPMAFIKQPLRWLKAISHYRATHSQAPNFAYAYCLKRITSEERATLDLSSWQAAGNAAEPINPEVMEQFCQTFESCGFRQSAFAPAYGLAEATLMVTTSRKTDDLVFCTVSASELAQNRIVETPTGQRLAGSGRLLGNTVVAIVHPETLTGCASDEVGEIWVSSAGVARGYWQRPDATQETFRAYLAETGEGPFLRTGDLGFIQDGELFVTGRLKDLIIIRGENYYPQDIEWVVEKSHEALRPNYRAGFSIEVDGVEQLVIVFEVERQKSKNLNVDEVVSAIRNAVAEHYELPVYAVVLLKRGSIPKTSSGKIQRQACRKAFLDGSLNSIAVWTLASASVHQKTTPQNDIEFQLIQIWQRVLGITSISTKDNFFELGGDSLKAASLVAEIENLFVQNIPLASLVEAPTIEQLTNFIILENREVKSRSLIPVKPNGGKQPFFYVHSPESFILARYIAPARPFYGLQAVGLDGQKAPYTCMKDIVAYYIQEIRTVQPEGPYLLGGLCIGGNIAFEIAQQLKKLGQQVSLVIMIDSRNLMLTKEEKLEFKKSIKIRDQKHREDLLNNGVSLKQVENIFKVLDANIEVLASHVPQIYLGKVVYFSSQEDITGSEFDPMQPNGWNSWVAGGIEVHKVPGNHMTLWQEPHVQILAEKMNACLEQAEREYEQEKVLTNLSQIQPILEKFPLLTSRNEHEFIDKIQPEQINQEPVQLQLAQEKLALTLAQLSASQIELAQLKAYFQQAHGVEGVMNYYRSRIASNPDDIQLYHQALEVKPDDAQIHLQLGNALVRQNHFDDAIASYQTALQFHPDNFEIHLELGKVLEKEKKWDEAIASYRRAIELNPDYSRLHKHLGDILAERGQINEASTCYRRALQLEPRIF
ncbi:AMP-binding protein [Microcoleus sp. AT13-A6]